MVRTSLSICLISAVLALAGSAGFMTPLHNATSGQRFKLVDRQPTGDIIFVDIDTKSIDSVGQWPWPRSLYATLFDKLKMQGATDIAFDIDFSSASTEAEDAAFEKALNRASGVIILPVFSQALTAQAGESRVHYNIPIDRFEQATLIGTVNVPVEADGRIRAYRLGAVVNGMPTPSLAVALAGLNGPVGGEFLIDFSIRADQIARFSAIDILDDQIAGHLVSGRKVVIGSSAQELRDFFWVPRYGLLSGPILHALAAETILQDRTLAQTGSLISVFGLGLLAALVLYLMRRMHWTRFLLILVLLSLAMELVSLMILQVAPILVDTSLWQASIAAFAVYSILRQIDVHKILLLIMRNEKRNTQTVLDRVIADNSDGIFIVEENGKVITVSRAGLEILKLETDTDYSDRSVEDILPEVLSGPVLNSISDHKEGIEAKLEQQEIELVLDNNDTLILEYSITPSRLGGGFSSNGRPKPDKHIACLTFRDITVRRQLERRLQYLATHDQLTGLANRTEFERRLADATKDEIPGSNDRALISIDLDRFKNINDTLGHDIGDQLLRLVSERLLNFAGSSNLVARFGGDEFAVLHFGETTKPKLAKLVQTIIDALSEPYDIYGHTVIIGASAGIAVGRGASGSGLELIRDADVALYGAKADRGNAYCFFEPQMGLKLQLRRSLELDLRCALDRGEFEIFYQPQTRLPNEGVVGVEALIRWHHPDRGLVSPADFIPVAEDIGLIEPIGAWLLKKACKDVVAWPVPIVLAVNLSSVQFNTGDLLKTVSDALSQSGLPPEQLELEITESLLMKETGSTLSILNSLRDMKASIAMDDFGTGYSSLSYIRKYPIDKIKIDRSFVMDLPDNRESLAIVHAIISIAKSLGMKITAEGIETAEQMEILTRAGCTYGQGYLLGKPVPARDLIGLLQPNPEAELLSA